MFAETPLAVADIYVDGKLDLPVANDCDG